MPGVGVGEPAVGDDILVLRLEAVVLPRPETCISGMIFFSLLLPGAGDELVASGGGGAVAKVGTDVDGDALVGVLAVALGATAAVDDAVGVGYVGFTGRDGPHEGADVGVAAFHGEGRVFAFKFCAEPGKASSGA